MAGTFLALAVMFIVALLLGRLAAFCKIPRVTGYLIAGILVGPSLHELLHDQPLLTHHMIDQLKVLKEMALALIIFSIGMEFRGERLQRFGKRLWKLTSMEIGMTFVLVVIAIAVIDFFAFKLIIQSGSHTFLSTMQLALFLGIISIATAPAATLFVIREYEAEGEMTELLLMLIGLNNLVAVSGFIFLSQFFFHDNNMVELLIKIMYPIGLGFAIGSLVSIWAQRLEQLREFQLLVIGAVILLIGLCHYLGISLMLAMFVYGTVLVNASPKEDKIRLAIKQIDYPIYVIFFVISGASMHLELLPKVGVLGGVYIVARMAGKIVGSWFGAKWGGFKQHEQQYLGMTLVAQAGVAIGLSHELSQVWKEGGQAVETLILGSLIFFEIAGPLFVRHGLVRAGEVSVLSLLVKKSSDSAFEGVHQVVNHFRDALGLYGRRSLKSAKDILVKHVMRKNVATIIDTMHFNDFLKDVAHSRYDRFPVVDKHGRFIGVVEYKDIREMIFDPSMADLLIVKDLIKADSLVLNGEQKLQEVFKIFKKYPNISYLPVIDKDHPDKLIGMLNHNTVLSMFRSLSSNS